MPLFFFDLCQPDAKVRLGSADLEDGETARAYAEGLADTIFGRGLPAEQGTSGTVLISDAERNEVGQVRSEKK